MNYRIQLDLYVDDEILTEEELSEMLYELIQSTAVECGNIKLIEILKEEK